MNNSLPDIDQLRNNIDFASIAQFFHTFQSAFQPWPVTTHDIIYSRTLDANEHVFETEDLERMILETSERIRFEDLLVRMLRLVSGKRFINSSTWQLHFSKEFDKREFDQENPFHQGQQQEGVTMEINYFTLPLNTRIHLLHLLCEWQLDEPDKFREHLESEQDALQWRVDPIGYDRKGSTFWLFDDNRLYKETPKLKALRNKKKRVIAPIVSLSTRKSSRKTRLPIEEEEEEEEVQEEGEWMPWKLICYTKYEWEQFPLKYVNSKNLDEQKFYTLLVNDLIPKIIPAMEDREKEIKMQEALIHRKRSSRIMIKELEALERSSSFEPSEIIQQQESEVVDYTKARTSNRLEKKNLEKEQKDQELAAKQREERVLERERRIMEREYRASIRESEDSMQALLLPVPTLLPSPVSDAATVISNDQPKLTKSGKPRKKYTKREKFDADGNPIPKPPKKEKLDEDGNPIPKQKRGRKPKNKDYLDEENWTFDCICGVSGKNLDDGSPMITCEKCGVWQHIKCLQKSGQVEKQKSLDDISFVCQKCENEQVVDIDGEDDQQSQAKKQKLDHCIIEAMNYQPTGVVPSFEVTSILPQQGYFFPILQHYSTSSSIISSPSSTIVEPPTSLRQSPQSTTPPIHHHNNTIERPFIPMNIFAQQSIPINNTIRQSASNIQQQPATVTAPSAKTLQVAAPNTAINSMIGTAPLLPPVQNDLSLPVQSTLSIQQAVGISSLPLTIHENTN